MARYLLVVNSNAAEGREQEYNDWYSSQHIADMRALPGVISARRFVLEDAQMTDGPRPFKYLALYEVETDNLQNVISELLGRARSGSISRSTALGADPSAIWWKEMV